MIIEHDPNQPSQYSPNGLIKLMNLFTNVTSNPKQKPRQIFTSPQTQLLLNKATMDILKLQSQKKQKKQTQQIITGIWKLINEYYLLDVIEKYFGISEVNANISDKKVLKAILSAYRTVIISKFVQNNKWNNHMFPAFMELLKQYRKQQINKLVASKPLVQDLQELYQLKKITEIPSNPRYMLNSQRYCLICQSVQQKNQPQLDILEIQLLFSDILQILYSWTDNRLQSKPSQEVCLKLEKIKVIMLYERCLGHLKNDKLGKFTLQSKVSVVLKQEGYQTLRRYFEDMGMYQIKSQKKYCRELFLKRDTSTIYERNSSEQESSQRKRDADDNMLPSSRMGNIEDKKQIKEPGYNVKASNISSSSSSDYVLRIHVPR